MAESKLPRVVSRWEIVALAINDVVGSGVYVILPVAAATLLGPASVWAILAAGFAVLLLVLCFAEAGSRFDEPGGAYVYTRAAFGELVGFEVGWMTWMARIATIAGLAGYFARAVGFLWDGARAGPGKWLVMFGSLAVLTVVNVRGVKAGARIAVALTWGKIVPLVVFVAATLPAIDWGRVFPIPTPDHHNFGKAALLVLFAYAGFENTPALAGEVEHPKRDVPFALLVTIGLVTAIYTLVQLVVIGSGDLGGSATPLAFATARVLGPVGGLVLTVGAALSVLGTINATVLSGPRYLYALAERGWMPAVFARLHPTYQTPWIAILTQTGLAFGLMATGTAEQLAELSVVARLATYVGTAASVPILRKRRPDDERTVRLPGGLLIPVAALAVCVVFLSAATRANLVAGAIALLVGAGIFFARRGRRE